MEENYFVEFKCIYRDHYKAYLSLGLVPYPASRNGKHPITQWKDDLPDPCSDDYAFWEQEYPNMNLWVKLGNKFAVLDPDGPDSENFVRDLTLPQCPTSISGNKSVHRWFKLSTPLKFLKVQVGDSFLEIRTGEQGMLAPPSIHPKTHRVYRWEEKLSPWEIAFPELPMCIYEKIAELIPRPKSFGSREEINGRDRSFAGREMYLDVPAYLTHYGFRYRVKHDAGRTIYLLERCLFADQHTTKNIPGDSSIIQGADGKLTYQCFHNHCAFKTWADARRIISGGDSLARFYPRLDLHIEHNLEEAEPPSSLLNSLSLIKMSLRGDGYHGYEK